MADLPTHIAVSLLILLILFKDDRKYVFLLLPLSILPDVDTLYAQHRTLFHSISIPLVLLFLGYIFKSKIKIFIIACIYIISHAILDVFNGGTVFFYPFINRVFFVDANILITKTREITWNLDYGFKPYDQPALGYAYGYLAYSIGIAIFIMIFLSILYRGILKYKDYRNSVKYINNKVNKVKIGR